MHLEYPASEIPHMSLSPLQLVSLTFLQLRKSSLQDPDSLQDREATPPRSTSSSPVGTMHVAPPVCAMAMKGGEDM